MEFKKKGVSRLWYFVLVLFLLIILLVLAVGPDVSLITPTDGQSFIYSNGVLFNCSIDSSLQIDNVSLYMGLQNTLSLNQTRAWGGEIPKESNQVLLLHFNNDSTKGESSTFVYDWSGNENNGTVVNVNYNSTGGKYNGAYYFLGQFYDLDEPNESIRISDSPSLDLISEGTLEAWIKPNMQTSTYKQWSIFSKGDSYPENSAYMISMRTSGVSPSPCRVQFNLGDGDSSQQLNSGEKMDCDGTNWYHVVATWDGSNMKLYLNGVLNSSASQTITPKNSDGILNIGKNTYYSQTYNGTIDEIALYNRSLTASEIAVHYGQKVTNTSQTFTTTNIPDGSYIWNCKSSDNSSQSNWATSNNSFVVDITAPVINSKNITPFLDDDLDPDIRINVTVNVTELFMNTALLQYRPIGPSFSWANRTLVNTSQEIYISNFTAQFGGDWQYRIWVEDNYNHTTISNTSNVSAELDYTWTYLPSTFSSVSGFLNANKSIGILIINNTGDFDLTIDLSSNWANTFFNVTEPFTMEAKAVKNINITVIFASTTREDDLSISVNATSANAVPARTTVNATLASYTGGPYLDVKVTSYTALINHTGSMDLSAYVNNLGNDTSYETWLNFSLPTGWSNVSGNMSLYVGNLGPGVTVYNSMTANVSSSASAGIVYIAANASNNESISDSESKLVVVSCFSGDDVCGTGCTYLTDSDCSRAVVTVTTGGGGTSSAPATGAARGLESIEISKTIHIARGEVANFTIDVNNTFKSSTLENITINITGFLIQYISVKPSRLHNIKTNATKSFFVEISPPNYLEYGNYTLEANIQGVILKQSFNTTILRGLEMKQYISLIVHEVSKDEVIIGLEKAYNLLNEIQEINLSHREITKRLNQAEEFLLEDKYEETQVLIDEITEIKELTLASFDKINVVKGYINDAETRGLDVSETKQILNLAIAAFEREDYEVAIQRLDEAELSYFVEIKGQFNVWKFLQLHWLSILITLICLTAIGFFIYSRIILSIVTRKLNRLEKGERAVLKLIKETQISYLDKKQISAGEYFNVMAGYYNDLIKIKQAVAKLRAKKRAIVTLDEELKSLERENTAIINIIKKVQVDYFEKRKINRTRYDLEMESEFKRLAEIDEAKALIKARMKIKKGPKKSFRKSKK